MKVAFLITAFDQMRCVRFTVDMLRNKWEKFKDSPIVIVISGDKERTLYYNDDPLTRVVHLDDMVGSDFNGKVSTSIMRQITHGMIEVRDLEREFGEIDYVLHMHGDVLLLNEDGFLHELELFRKSGKIVAADPVGAQRSDYIYFDGYELMPQLFVVNHKYCKKTNFMYHMDIRDSLETKSTEWALIRNLCRSTPTQYDEKTTFLNCVYPVCVGRPQWGLHSHWGGWTHFGNQLHYPKDVLEAKNVAILRAHNIDMSAW